MQKGFAPLLILVTALVVIAAGATYYFGIKKPEDFRTKVSRQNPDFWSSLSPGPTNYPEYETKPIDTDETANWKTYTDNVDNFIVKYPQSWSVERLKNQIIFATTDQPGERIELTVNDENDKSLEPFKKLQNINNNPISVKEATVGVLTVNEVHHTSCITNSDCITVVVKSGGKIFAFSPWIQSERYDDLKIIYQMLSTFKFQ